MQGSHDPAFVGPGFEAHGVSASTEAGLAKALSKTMTAARRDKI